MHSCIVGQPAINTTTVQSTSYATLHITVNPVPDTSSSVAATSSPSTSSYAAPFSSAATSASPSSSTPASSESSSSSSSTSPSPVYNAPSSATSTSTSSVYYAPSPSTSSSESSIYYAPSLSSSTSSSSVYYAPSSSSYVAPSAVSSSSASAPSPSSSTIEASGSQWCMTYSPYNADSSCKDNTAVSSDISIIASKGFSCIRIYSTDCSSLQNVGSAALSHSLKLILGVYISSSGISAAASQITEITSWAAGNWASIEMIVIGNEAIFNNYCSASDLATFITTAKESFKQAGYTGPTTTTEPLNILQENSATLCPVLDCAAANIHPYFNANTCATDAGTFVASALAELETLCPGLDAYNLETGWPKAGNPNGDAVPGVSEQETAIAAIKSAAGGKSVFFSYIDDLWKQPGPLGVEQNWGCSQLFGS